MILVSLHQECIPCLSYLLLSTIQHLLGKACPLLSPGADLCRILWTPMGITASMTSSLPSEALRLGAGQPQFFPRCPGMAVALGFYFQRWHFCKPLSLLLGGSVVRVRRSAGTGHCEAVSERPCHGHATSTLGPHLSCRAEHTQLVCDLSMLGHCPETAYMLLGVPMMAV